MKAIRGANTVLYNTKEDIGAATVELLTEIARRNGIGPEDVISAFFTLSHDINAAFPAEAARAAGWDIPMLDLLELPVAGAMEKCLRVLIHVDREDPVQHVYLGDARKLRPDLEPPT
jgi:chorismate mutase